MGQAHGGHTAGGWQPGIVPGANPKQCLRDDLMLLLDWETWMSLLRFLYPFGTPGQGCQIKYRVLLSNGISDNKEKFFGISMSNAIFGTHTKTIIPYLKFQLNGASWFFCFFCFSGFFLVVYLYLAKSDNSTHGSFSS